MDCDLTWPSRPFRHRVAQFLFQMHLTLFLASIALYRPPHLPPVSQSSNPSVSSPMSATLAQSMLQMCAVHYTHENLLCVSKTCGWAAECRGQRGESNLWSECCHVQNPDCHVAMLPCCTIVQNPDSRCLEHLSFPSPSMPSFINHLYCTRG